MGLIRLWLALLVYFEHLGGFGLSHLLTGIIAVKSFFIISGFLIQLVLLRKYHDATRFWQFDFLKSRFIRIYPLYWIVLLGSLIFLVVTGVSPRLYNALPIEYGMTYEVLHHKLIFDHDNLVAKIWYIASHILIFGYDIGQYIIYNMQQAKFTLIGSTPYIGHLWGRSFMLIPQGWSMAIELWFYLLAPFILLRSTIFIIVLTILVTYIRRHIHFDCSVYAMDIFGSLFYFIIGAMACRFYLKYLQNATKKYHYLSFIMLLGLFIYTLNFKSLNISNKEGLFYVMLACSLPVIFNRFHKNPIDRFLGDLSYPIYLVHFLASGFVVATFHSHHNAIIKLLLTLLFAAIVVFLVERPLDRLRHKLFQKKLETIDRESATREIDIRPLGLEVS